MTYGDSEGKINRFHSKSSPFCRSRVNLPIDAGQVQCGYGLDGSLEGEVFLVAIYFDRSFSFPVRSVTK